MKKAHLIAIILIVIAIGAILTTLSDSSTYASFDIARENPETEYHVVGIVNKQKEMKYAPLENANLFSFYLLDNKGEERKVLYNGTKPQDFEKSEQIVVIGNMAGEEYHASSILMKCPSKYQDTNKL